MCGSGATPLGCIGGAGWRKHISKKMIPNIRLHVVQGEPFGDPDQCEAPGSHEDTWCNNLHQFLQSLLNGRGELSYISKKNETDIVLMQCRFAPRWSPWGSVQWGRLKWEKRMTPLLPWETRVVFWGCRKGGARRARLSSPVHPRLARSRHGVADVYVFHAHHIFEGFFKPSY